MVSGTRSALGILFLIVVSVPSIPAIGRRQGEGSHRNAEASQARSPEKLTDRRSDERLIQIARRYLFRHPVFYRGSRLRLKVHAHKNQGRTSDLTLRQEDGKWKAHIELGWFLSHDPKVLYYKPEAQKGSYSYLNGRYGVLWRYMPSCKQRPGTSEWYDPGTGSICLGGLAVQVLIAPTLKPERVEVDVLQ